MVFTLDGKNVVVDWLATESDAPGFFGTGSGSTIVDESDSALEGEFFPLGGSRIAMTVLRGAQEVKYDGTLTTGDGNGSVLREYGLFNANTAGSMFTRIVHSELQKNSTFEVNYLITVRVQ